MQWVMHPDSNLLICTTARHRLQRDNLNWRDFLRVVSSLVGANHQDAAGGRCTCHGVSVTTGEDLKLYYFRSIPMVHFFIRSLVVQELVRRL